MNSEIQIIEKPEWVSWKDIQKCLTEAHSVNRNKGINMVKYRWTIDKLIDSIGTNGKMMVALDGRKVVGTAALGGKNDRKWYVKGDYGYLSLSSVLPEYSGQGIYKKLNHLREETAALQGYSLVLFDTHEKNKRRRSIAEASGYRVVNYFRAGDHYNVVMAKWLSDCPYSTLYCKMRFVISYFRAHLSSLFLFMR